MKDSDVKFVRKVIDPEETLILVTIEGNPSLLEQVSNVCERVGYVIAQARSSGEAITLMQQCSPSVFIVGLTSGESEVLQWCRNHHPAASVLLLTEESGVDRSVEALKSGAHDYFITPVNEDELKRLIDDAVLTHRTKAYDIAISGNR